jgi:hypothetical protein
VLVLGTFSHSSLIIAGKDWSLPKKRAPERWKVLLTIVRLGWKAFQVTNTLAYFAAASATKRKCCITTTPVACTIKLLGL